MNFNIKLILMQLIVINFALANEDKPFIQEFLVPKNLNEDQPIKLGCELLHGKLPITIDWYFNGNRLENNNRIKIKRHDDSATLMIKSLSADDNGDYYCLATNQYGQHKRYAYVYVNTKPKWKVEPNNITSLLNKEIVLECDAKSYPKSEIQWIRLSSNGKELINKFNTNTLKLNLKKETSGYYKCLATNPIGSIEKIIYVGYFSGINVKNPEQNSRIINSVNQIK